MSDDHQLADVNGRLQTQPKRGDYLPAFVPTIELDPSHTALLIIDMQYASASRECGLGRLLRESGRAADGEYRFDRIEQVVVPNIRRLLALFRSRALPVVFLTIGSSVDDYSDLGEHVREFARAVGNRAGQREHEILDELRPLPNEVVLNKTTVGGFSSSSLEAVLHALGTRSLAIAGVSTNSCVETTARDAADRGFRCVLVEDGCAAARAELHDATLTSFGRLFGRVASTDAVLAELTAPVAAQ
jgi:nicotinamidase-related amidase